jgi:biopolymer transport protein ExbB
MNLQQAFEKLALVDMSWVVWVLVLMSVLSVAIMLERVVFFWRWAKVSHEEALSKLQSVLEKRSYVQGAREFAAMRGTSAAVLSAGLEKVSLGAGAAEEAMLGVLAREKLQLERYFTFLGTVSNNAPFLACSACDRPDQIFLQVGQSRRPT